MIFLHYFVSRDTDIGSQKNCRVTLEFWVFVIWTLFLLE